jgi:DNA-directed RNA polymerase specialized sigma24 family protein
VTGASGEWGPEFRRAAARAAEVLWRRWRSRCGPRGIDREEFGQIAEVAAWQAMQEWDPARSPTGGEGVEPYLHQQAGWRVANALKGLFVRKRDHAPPVGLREELAPAVRDAGPDLADARHDAEAVLRLAQPEHRALLEAVAAGRTLREAGAELGLSRLGVKVTLAEARRQALRRLGHEG